MEKLKLLITIGLCVLTVSGCARLVRTGYSEIVVNPAELEQTKNIPIVKNYSFDEKDIIKIGKFKVRDSGFTIRCSKGDVLKIVQDEAKSQGADVINIVWEAGFDLLSTCYRVEVELIRFVDQKAANKYVL